MTKKKILILDLDETLIFTHHEKLAGLDLITREPVVFPSCKPYYIHKRPHLDEFLQSVSQHFDIGIWSAGAKIYVDFIVDKLFNGQEKRPILVFSKERCIIKQETIRGRSYIIETVKPLRKVKRLLKVSMDDIIVVDDLPCTYKNNYGNAIPVKPFYGRSDDDELVHLERYLVEYVAPIEGSLWRRSDKRDWHASIKEEPKMMYKETES